MSKRIFTTTVIILITVFFGSLNAVPTVPLYSLDSATTIEQIDDTDGSILGSIGLTLGGDTLDSTAGGFSVDPTTGHIYALMEVGSVPGKSQLVTINRFTGAVTKLGDTTVDVGDFKSIVFDASGSIFGITNESVTTAGLSARAIYPISKATGALGAVFHVTTTLPAQAGGVDDYAMSFSTATSEYKVLTGETSLAKTLFEVNAVGIPADTTLTFTASGAGVAADLSDLVSDYQFGYDHFTVADRAFYYDSSDSGERFFVVDFSVAPVTLTLIADAVSFSSSGLAVVPEPSFYAIISSVAILGFVHVGRRRKKRFA